MQSLPRNGTNRGERALNLAASVHFSPLLLQWAKTMKVKKLFVGKSEEGRARMGKVNVIHSRRIWSFVEAAQSTAGTSWV